MDNPDHKEVRSQANFPDESTLLNISELFGMLADVTRLKIVMTLKNSPLCVQDLAAAVGMSASAVSHQLRLLKAMNLVRFKKAGKMKFYSLDDSHIDQLLNIANEHVDEE